MKTQRVFTHGGVTPTWIVIDDAYRPVEFVNEFLRYLTTVDRSPNTVRAYASALKTYALYLANHKIDWVKVGFKELTGFVAELTEPVQAVSMSGAPPRIAQRTNSTVNAIMAGVKGLYEYYRRRGVVTELEIYQSKIYKHSRYKHSLYGEGRRHPVEASVLTRKTARTLPRRLTRTQVDLIVRACSNERDRFLIQLLDESGLRIGQALGLRHSDVDVERKVIAIVRRRDNANGALSKRRETYEVHISDELIASYVCYLVDLDTPSDYVFVNLCGDRVGRPLTSNSVTALCRRLTDKTGIAFTPHLFRHTHAKDFAASGADSRYIQERLGHASRESSEIYTLPDHAEMKRQFNNFRDARQQLTGSKPS